MSALPVLVFPDHFAVGYPSPDGRPPTQGQHLSLDALVTTRFLTDAHFTGFHSPSHPLFRISVSSVAETRPLMHLLILDVDNHQAAAGWWEAEQPKLAKLAKQHPHLFYRTRGGYRLAWTVADPIQLTSPEDAERWKVFYFRVLLYVRREFGIEADPKCADWPHVFRAPHATRDPGGAPEELEVRGAPEPWNCPPQNLKADIDLAVSLGWRPVVEKLTPKETKDSARVYGRAALKSGAAKVASAPAGERNDTLNNQTFSLAGLVDCGALTLGEIEDEMSTAAATAGLDHVEAAATIRSALRAGIAHPRTLPVARGLVAPAQAPNPTPLTDLGNAERFAARNIDSARYVFCWQRWIFWDGRVWREDGTDEVVRRAKAVARAVAEEASAIQDEDAAREKRVKLFSWGIRSEAAGRIAAMVDLAKAEPGMGILPEHLDTDPWLLNVRNGIIDLRTGELRPHDKERLCAKIADVAYDPKAKAPLWTAFLDRILGQELADYMRRAVGYSLTGSMREQCIFVLHGLGANGKSTFVDTIRTLLGDYATQSDPKAFQEKKSDSISNDIARLKGSRFVAASETESGGRLAESLVKQMTGGEPLTARFLHKEFFTFRPEFKVFLATNHKPVIRGADEAIWRRIKLIPFSVTIPEEERDKRFPIRLQEELPGILAWAVRGCIEWQKVGLLEPAAIKAATKEYRVEMDVLDAYIKEKCRVASPTDPPRVAAGVKDESKNLYISYKNWCQEFHEEPMKRRAFGMALRERGFVNRQNAHGHIEWVGIRVLTNEDMAERSVESRRREIDAYEAQRTGVL